MRFYDEFNASKRFWGPNNTVAAAGTVTLDLAKGKIFGIAYTGATFTIANPLNAKPGDRFVLHLHNAVGASTPSFGTLWANEGAAFAVTATAGKTDILECFCDQPPQTVTVTLSGSSGTANITVGGVAAALATFATDLTTTANNWVTANAAAYLTAGWLVTASVGVITFVKLAHGENIANVPSPGGLISNVTLTLNGTVANTTKPYIIRTMAHKNYVTA
jgi:hypothetical protein